MSAKCVASQHAGCRAARRRDVLSSAVRHLRQPVKREVCTYASSSSIDKRGKDVVRLAADWSKVYTVKSVPSGTSISDYMAGAQQNLQGYQLPLGAELKIVDPIFGKWELAVPKLQFLDVYVKCALPSAASRQGIESVYTCLDSTVNCTVVCMHVGWKFPFGFCDIETAGTRLAPICSGYETCSQVSFLTFWLHLVQAKRCSICA